MAESIGVDVLGRNVKNKGKIREITKLDLKNDGNDYSRIAEEVLKGNIVKVERLDQPSLIFEKNSSTLKKLKDEIALGVEVQKFKLRENEKLHHLEPEEVKVIDEWKFRLQDLHDRIDDALKPYAKEKIRSSLEKEQQYPQAAIEKVSEEFRLSPAEVKKLLREMDERGKIKGVKQLKFDKIPGYELEAKRLEVQHQKAFKPEKWRVVILKGKEKPKRDVYYSEEEAVKAYEKAQVRGVRVRLKGKGSKGKWQLLRKIRVT